MLQKSVLKLYLTQIITYIISYSLFYEYNLDYENTSIFIKCFLNMNIYLSVFETYLLRTQYVPKRTIRS